MPEKTIGERINKAISLLKSKGIKNITLSSFYFDFYMLFEKSDASSDSRFTYMQIFSLLEKENKIVQEGLVWRVII